MEQRSLVLSLRLEGLSKKTIHIHHDLVAVVQENTVSYSTLAKFSREAILGLNS
jgi:hypothetical protein